MAVCCILLLGFVLHEEGHAATMTHTNSDYYQIRVVTDSRGTRRTMPAWPVELYTVDGKVGFCVEPTVDARPGSGYATTISNWYVSRLKNDRELQLKMGLAVHFGFHQSPVGYVSGSTKARVFTQMFIQRLLIEDADYNLSVAASVTRKVHAAYFRSDSVQADYLKFEKSVKESIRSTMKDNLSYHNQTFQVLPGQNLRIEEKNGVSHLFELIESSKNGVHAHMDGDHLVIRVDENAPMGEMNLKLRRKLFTQADISGSNLFYRKTASKGEQTIGVLDLVDPHHNRVDFNVGKKPMGWLDVVKFGIVGGGPIEKTEFRIAKTPEDLEVDGKYWTRFTGPTGSFTTEFYNEVGTWYLKEMTVREPFVADGKIIKMEIKEGVKPERNDLNYWVGNMPKFGSLTIRKVDDTTKKPLPAAQLKVTYIDNAYPRISGYQAAFDGKDPFLEGDSFVVTTNEKGEAVYKNRRLSEWELPLGEYAITEIKAPAGYELASVENIARLTFEEPKSEVTVGNEKLMGQISLEKGSVHSDTAFAKHPVSKAVYDVILKSLLIDDSSGAYKIDTVVDTIVTDNAGKGKSKSLPLGTYDLVEKTAPVGYAIHDVAVRVELTLNTTQTGAPVVMRQLSHHRDSLVAQLTRQIERYNETLVEYKIDRTPYPVLLEEAKEITAAATVYDKLKLGYVLIHKAKEALIDDNLVKEGAFVDESGAVFEIVDSSGKVVDTITSNENGTGISTLLPVGKYSLRQTKAAHGTQRIEPLISKSKKMAMCWSILYKTKRSGLG